MTLLGVVFRVEAGDAFANRLGVAFGDFADFSSSCFERSGDSTEFTSRMRCSQFGVRVSLENARPVGVRGSGWSTKFGRFTVGEEHQGLLARDAF